MTHQPMLGIGIGDALGMPFETLPHFSSALTGWDGQTFLDAPTDPESGYSHGLKAGQWTDDTQMSICLAESLVACPTYKPEDAAQRYLAWFNSGDARGIGGATRRACEKLNQGTPWTESGTQGSMGSGTAMRAIPLGIAYRNAYIQELREAAYQDASITHQNDAAKEASFIVAYVARHLALSHIHLPVELFASLLSEGSRVGNAITKAEKARTQDDMLAIGTGGSCYEVVGTALACLRTTQTYEEAVTQAIRLGGDTDTRAAIVGGWAGITREIPEAWIKQVERPDLLMALDASLLALSR